MDDISILSNQLSNTNLGTIKFKCFTNTYNEYYACNFAKLTGILNVYPGNETSKIKFKATSFDDSSLFLP